MLSWEMNWIQTIITLNRMTKWNSGLGFRVLHRWISVERPLEERASVCNCGPCCHHWAVERGSNFNIGYSYNCPFFKNTFWKKLSVVYQWQQIFEINLMFNIMKKMQPVLLNEWVILYSAVSSFIFFSRMSPWILTLKAESFNNELCSICLFSFLS